MSRVDTRTKTIITNLKLTPEVRALWEQCLEPDDRALTNLFEVVLRDCAKRRGVRPDLDRLAALLVAAGRVPESVT